MDMTEKEKEQKALEIYRQLMHELAEIADKEGVIEIVNTLIDENGLSSPVDGKESVLSAKKKRSGDDEEAFSFPNCGSAPVRGMEAAEQNEVPL